MYGTLDCAIDAISCLCECINMMKQKLAIGVIRPQEIDDHEVSKDEPKTIATVTSKNSEQICRDSAIFGDYG